MSSKKRLPVRKATATVAAAAGASSLLGDIEQLIREARHSAAVAVNVSQTKLYGSIGKRVRDEVLGFQRAGYGEEIVATLSRQLVSEHGRGFERKNLHRMAQVAEVFPDQPTVAALWRQLSWSHDGVDCGDWLRRSARRRQFPRPRPSNASEASA